ncbi:MAG: O-antigen ligase family protein [Ruminococcaceae bacterium]|nr:O-antigen ligase family protein [Oscillospiraceae bacterium]
MLLMTFLLICSEYGTIFATKVTFFYIICGGYVALILLLCLESLLVGMIKPRDVLKIFAPSSLLQIFMLFYLGFTLISAFLSEYPTVWTGLERKEGFGTIAIYVLCFYFVARFIRAQKWMIYFFGAFVTIFGVISVIQFCGISFLYPKGMNYYDAYTKYSSAHIGTLGNVDFAAAFLALAIPIFLVYIVKAEEKQRFYLLVPLLLSLGVMLKIWVLSGIIGILAIFAVTIPPAFSFKRKGIIIYWSVFVFFMLIGLATIYFVRLDGGLFGELHNILHGNISESFGTGRLYIWHQVLSRIPDNLFFGTGPDTMLYANIEPFYRTDPVYGGIIALIESAHNEYLNILFHQGIFAFLSYVCAVMTVVIQFFKNASKSREVLILGAALIGYLVCAFFGISTLATAPFFWVCLGFFDKYSNKEKIK